jgi:uncharacterized membrane protein
VPELFDDDRTRRAAKVVFVIFIVALALTVAVAVLLLSNPPD